MMSVARQAEVTRLSDIALTAMQEKIGDATSTEVISACMSLALTTILAVQDCGGNLEAFREPLARMYALLPPLRTH